jgi:hypothetical protein
MRSRVSSATPGLPRTTNDTAETETLAASATSRMLGRRLFIAASSVFDAFYWILILFF